MVKLNYVIDSKSLEKVYDPRIENDKYKIEMMKIINQHSMILSPMIRNYYISKIDKLFTPLIEHKINNWIKMEKLIL